MATQFRDSTRAYGTVERVAVSSTSAQTTTAIAASEVMLHASTKLYFLVGSNPTAAATTGIPLEAGEKFHLQITPGQKIAFIRDTTDGYVHITQVL